jgi:O-antigen/teichoic acid export membrane protein
MNRTRVTLLNSISSTILLLTNTVAGFITPSILLRTYGSEIYGLIASISQILSFFQIVEGGLAGSTIFALYKPLIENDHKSINAIISASKKFYIYSGYVFVFLASVLSLIYPFFIKTNYLTFIETSLLVLVLSISSAFEFFALAKYSALLTADKKNYILSLALSAATIANIIIVTILASIKINIIILRTCTLSSYFLRSFILYTYVKKKYSYINFNEEPNDDALKNRWDALYLQVGGVIHASAPLILITFLTNLKMVSVYSIYNMIIQNVCGILGILTNGLISSFGDVIARNEILILQKSYKEFEFLFFSVTSVIFSVTIITIGPFVRIYTTGINDNNFNLPVIPILIVLNSFIGYARTIQGTLVISAGLYRETRTQVTLQALIAVVIGIVLSYPFGVEGIIIGSIISNIYRNIDLLFFIPRNVTHLPTIISFKRQCIMYINAFVVYFPFFFIKINPHTYLSWFISVIIISLYAAIVVFGSGLIFENNEVRNIITRITSLINQLIQKNYSTEMSSSNKI